MAALVGIAALGWIGALVYMKPTCAKLNGDCKACAAVQGCTMDPETQLCIPAFAGAAGNTCVARQVAKSAEVFATDVAAAAAATSMGMPELELAAPVGLRCVSGLSLEITSAGGFLVKAGALARVSFVADKPMVLAGSGGLVVRRNKSGTGFYLQTPALAGEENCAMSLEPTSVPGVVRIKCVDTWNTNVAERIRYVWAPLSRDGGGVWVDQIDRPDPGLQTAWEVMPA